MRRRDQMWCLRTATSYPFCNWHVAFVSGNLEVDSTTPLPGSFSVPLPTPKDQEADLVTTEGPFSQRGKTRALSVRQEGREATCPSLPSAPSIVHQAVSHTREHRNHTRALEVTEPDVRVSTAQPGNARSSRGASAGFWGGDLPPPRQARQV